MSNYQDAGNYLLEYYFRRTNADRLIERRTWFMSFNKLVKGDVRNPSAIQDVLKMTSPETEDDNAANIAKRGTDEGDVRIKERRARARTMMMAALHQAVRRQFVGSGTGPARGMDAHRRSVDDRIASTGLTFHQWSVMAEPAN